MISDWRQACRRNWDRTGLLGVIIVVVLSFSSLAKLLSPYSERFSIPVFAYYCIATYELVIAGLYLTRWGLAADMGTMLLALIGIVLAYIRRDGGECGCWGGLLPYGKQFNVVVLGVLGACAACHFGSKKDGCEESVKPGTDSMP